MNSSVHLAVDLGAGSGRVMAVHWDGERASIEEVRRFANEPVAIGRTLRWDLPGLWREVELGLAQAAQRFAGRVASVGVDTWALDYVLLSSSDEWMGLPFCYRDDRIRGSLDLLAARASREEVYAATGVQFMEINTLCQWLAHHEASPEVFNTAARFQMIPDWMHWALCGARSVEFTNATTTQFLDPASRGWARGLLGRCGLPTHLLPELVEPGAHLGELQDSVRKRTGLGPIPVIAPATHDTASAVVGTPAGPGGGWAYVSAGTWFLVGVERQAPLLGAEALERNVTNEGGYAGTWRTLKNVAGLWLFDQVRRSLGGPAGPMEAAMLASESLGAAELRCFADPDDPRLLNPPDMAAALRAICGETGQRLPTTAGELGRCALESAALKTAHVLDELELLTGEPIEVVHVVGGGARNPALCQWIANASRRPVLAGPAEATALGNAMVQLASLKRIGSLAEIRDALRASTRPTRFEPEPDASGRWAAARERFAGLVVHRR